MSLQVAAQCNNIETAQLLLECGAEIKVRTTSTERPPHCAAQQNSKDTAKFLLEHHAEIKARDENDTTPLHCATCTQQLRNCKIFTGTRCRNRSKDGRQYNTSSLCCKEKQ